ncbi:class I adenylate-forming enzyme family protein [Pseudomonas sp. RIT-PI-AD]|uniref:class I adenylate-forming enzyme family protein n=1 Tax=Pseudomonas sp. RIT-PI-AD TaxID=3035294 RepID=UPI0021DA9B86|nr:class I adenylate-forming enzyme family protein [Pseudomonas sp. RIT-PI-AD]
MSIITSHDGAHSLSARPGDSAASGSPAAAAEARRAAYYRQGYWRDQDLWTSIQASTAGLAGRLALIDGEQSLTFARLSSEARAFAAGLRQAGVEPGDVVLIHARNGLHSSLALLACACLGAVMAPIPPMFAAAQVSQICRSVRARLLFALGDERERAAALEGARDAGCVETCVVPDDHRPGPGLRAWSSLRASVAEAPRQPRDADALALLVYSSGTTGAPKGVMHSANTLRYAVEQRARMHGVAAGEVSLVASQFGFVGSVVFGLLAGPLLGLTSVLMRAWNGDEAVRLIARHRIGYGLLMPTHVHDILASPLLESSDLSSFRRCAMGGLTRERRLDVRRRLCPSPLPAYGMSECLGFASCTPTDDDDLLLGCDGYPFPGTEVRIVDDAGLEVATEMAGHILVRGPSRFLGYYDAASLSAAALDGEGFFRTGDLGRLDARGGIHYVAREKDMIRRGGVSIVPGDLEAALAGHPRIEHVAVVGLPDARLGERACACVITRDGLPLTLEEVCRHLEQRGVARYTWPERVERFDSFPRSASLKVQKGVLIDLLSGTP